MNASPWQLDDVWVSYHCLDRVHLDHPTAGWRGTLRILGESREVDAREVAGFLERHSRACQDHYYLTPGELGILVLTPGRPEHARAWTMVTYLRLSPGQREAARRLWGGADRE